MESSAQTCRRGDAARKAGLDDATSRRAGLPAAFVAHPSN
jgi:hypothetical protein